MAAEKRNVALSSANTRPAPARGDQDATERRPGHPEDERAHELVQRVGLREPLSGHDVRHEGVERRGEEGGARAVQGGEDRDVPDLQDPGEREAGQDGASECAQEIRGNHQRPPGEAVARHAADEQEHDRRHRHRDSDERHRGWRIGQLVDLPRHRDQEGAIAEQ